MIGGSFPDSLFYVKVVGNKNVQVMIYLDISLFFISYSSVLLLLYHIHSATLVCFGIFAFE